MAQQRGWCNTDISVAVIAGAKIKSLADIHKYVYGASRVKMTLCHIWP